MSPGLMGFRNWCTIGQVPIVTNESSDAFLTQWLCYPLDQVERAIPFQRIGRAHEIAKVALFLASEAASYVTGTMIYSDGGISLRDSNMVRSS